MTPLIPDLCSFSFATSLCLVLLCRESVTVRGRLRVSYHTPPFLVAAAAAAAAVHPSVSMSSPSSILLSDHAAAVLASCVDDWRYLSEGKLNLVCTFRPADATAAASILTGQVMKINKDILRMTSDPHVTSNALVHRLHFAQRYVRTVMKPLFAAADSACRTGDASSVSSDLFDAGRLVWVPSSLLSSLLARARSCRPAGRVVQFSSFVAADPTTRVPVLLFEDYTAPQHLHLHRSCRPAGRVAQFSSFAAAEPTTLLPVLLLEDYTAPQHLHLHLRQTTLSRAPASAPPTICIEIKPKWGYLPRRATTNGIAAVKYDTCRYCMHQYLKFKKGEGECRTIRPRAHVVDRLQLMICMFSRVPCALQFHP
jgi:hypothetical protein